MNTTAKTLTVFLLAFYLAWVARATLFYSAVDLAIPDETGRLIFSNVVKFLLWVLPAAAYVLWLEHDNPWMALKITTPVDTSGLAVGLLVSLFYFVSMFSFEKFQSGRTLVPLLQAAPGAWLVTFAQVFFSPISEEIMFRGFVLPQLGNHMQFWQANILQALLFTAIHWPNWIWVSLTTPGTGGLQASILVTSIGIFVLALLLGWLLRRSNSVWPPVVIHIINNFLAAYLA